MSKTRVSKHPFAILVHYILSAHYTHYINHIFFMALSYFICCAQGGVGRDPKDVLRVKKERITNNVVAKMLKMFTFCPDKV